MMSVLASKTLILAFMHSKRTRFQNFCWGECCWTPQETCAFGASFFHSNAFATYSVLKTLLKTLPLFTGHFTLLFVFIEL